jgi:hypothetical protein
VVAAEYQRAEVGHRRDIYASLAKRSDIEPIKRIVKGFIEAI